MLIINPAVRWALQLVGAVALGWALVALFGGQGLIGLFGGAGVALASGRGARELRPADRAITTHTDPGPPLRGAADDRARSLLAHPRYDSWLGMAVLGATGAACLVVASVRDEAWTIVPGVLLVVLALVVRVLHRRGLHAAAWWVESPPFDRESQA